MIIKKTETITKNVQIGVTCDVCAKEKLFNVPNNGGSTIMPCGWLEFESGHYDWGNDSCDSVEKHHVCSAKCYVIKLKYCLDRLERNHSGYIGDFELELARDLVKLFAI